MSTPPRKTTVKAQDVLKALTRHQAQHEISIIKLSEPITSYTPQEPRQRTSDASNASLEGPTPASLEADLVHYSELFSKLRFSYVEQVTKEKFIRAIVGDPPLIVSMQENLELEKHNLEAKAELKSLKQDVANMVEDLEHKARQLSQRYESIQLDTTRLEELPRRIHGLQAQVAELKSSRATADANPDMNLPLIKTRHLVSRRQAEQQEVTRELEALQSKFPRKRKEAERLEAELGPLETKRQNSRAAAREAKRRKEVAMGGVGDDLEQRAKWWRASEGILTQLLGTKS
ncbi:hypothetical protein LMH87_002219 [Akanthomyces muscarius]|uniref:Kinetochore protein Sos7 coiled-coil domain-containing protein n=2 Tax=Akanthomyces TaxID=150366 RepID=A0A168FLA2_CORDF|nr:hypothetical protein LMH87_002219 [Akanthomyces muscarius]KAJ4147711.1 hypothetical protein LMH87_002219 [Akanthomyces muscarius]OAA75334.1 hypothetical protein LEL_07322 [Akanthomyces lecanii RCEF 1005]